MTPRTPLMQQYYAAKAEHPAAVVAMRVGDFFEFYGEDAETAARTLEITLTGKEDGSNGRIPMCGVPFHSVEKYLARLVAAGLKVALCDQLEDPKAAKGLVRRGVTRVLTPGTLIEDSMLSAGQNNFLAAICFQGGKLGLATLDPSTGEFAVTEIEDDSQERLIQEIARLHPAELLVSPELEEFGAALQGGLQAAMTSQKPPSLDRSYRSLLKQFAVANLQGFGCEDKPSAQVAAAMILAYAEQNKLPLDHVASVTTYSVDGFMRLDNATRRSLEITANLSDGSRRMTLLEVVDSTRTAMGARLIRRWLQQPLLDVEVIRQRHDAVERLAGHTVAREDIREALDKLHDIERLAARTSAGIAGPRDLSALHLSLLNLPLVREPLRLVAVGMLESLRQNVGSHDNLVRLLDGALVATPPLTTREGGVFRAGYDLELDKLRELGRNGKDYIASLERDERERSGISNLKVGFNSVFGYYLEVPKAQVPKVPEHYIRKQTTANGERYITAELKEHESLVLGAEEKAIALENDLFNSLRAQVAADINSVLQTARALAELDLLASFADTAVRRNYVRPIVETEDVFEVEGGRHAVVEAAASGFVPNDLSLDDSTRVMILTGPNMSGKSTFLRQNALIALLAQVGSFVPARSCRLGLVDRIFARIGAKDELATGQSTFMVEMVESANILNHATSRSLVILDEVGRGTSTYDGLAIAWAMIEYLAAVGSKTMFATHYHQLNELADQITNVSNFRVAVEEYGDQIVWTHRILPGGTDRSYGIHVARMAGVPSEVLIRSTEILADLEGNADGLQAKVAPVNRVQLTLFEAEEPKVVQELRELNLDSMTPMEALTLLDKLKRKYAPGVR